MTLRGVLRVPQTPILHPASLRGWDVKMWGPYRALVPGSDDSIVRGAIYECSETDVPRLAAYETSKYRMEEVTVLYDDDGSAVSAWCFVWDDRREDLKDA